MLAQGRVVTNTIPHHLRWIQHPINNSEVFSRRADTKLRASERRRAKPTEISLGDLVFIKDGYPDSKSHLPFEQHAWVVMRHQGTMINANQGDDQVTRNVFFFEKIHGTIKETLDSPHQL
ncbi:hypothetical protein NDU88_006125 [Pleurodeles waltl]|uniref:Uncharacterized protein n=1 Tax=Pleurodeles waltl TaxID=8319 RepID=A0AAV7NQW8_PLEWA|nr:hypothetical protein NDU88_006125 [Pleurodeles waltl]